VWAVSGVSGASDAHRQDRHARAALAGCQHRRVRGHGHDHLTRPNSATDSRWLLAALVLIGSFMVAEVIVGFAAGSLALLSDAAHMLTDAGALVLALVGLRLARRRPAGGYTFGLQRAEILSAQANGLTLLLFGAWIGYEAVRRLIYPAEVAGLPVLLTALAGVAVNLVAVALIRRADRTRLSVEGAYLHVVTDLAAFVATAIAAVVIMTTGFRRADSLASLIVVALMIRAGIALVRDSGRVLLEAAPAGLDPDRIGRELAGHRGVVEVHDLHIWEITSGSPALSAHVIVAPALDCHQVRLELEDRLRHDYDLRHTTLQVDHAQPELHQISRAYDPPA
jgi:cobalt-zinc-cadmium efflux system protein